MSVIPPSQSEAFLTLAGERDLSSLCGLLVQGDGLEPQVGTRLGRPHRPETQVILNTPESVPDVTFK